MALDNANIFKARGYALQGGAFTAFLLVFALLTFRIGQLEAALIFVPLAGVYLWPRNATSALSAILIFGLGLAVDVLSGGPVGLWAFLYLSLFGVFRPDLRGTEKGLYTAWSSFCIWVLLVIALTWLIGAVFVSGRTDWMSLVTQGSVAVILFPLVYVLRNGVYRILSDPDSAEAGI